MPLSNVLTSLLWLAGTWLALLCTLVPLGMAQEATAPNQVEPGIVSDPSDLNSAVTSTDGLSTAPSG